MRAMGIVKRVDELGRVVIPKILRQELCIQENDPLEIFYDLKENSITFRKYQADALIAEHGLTKLKEFFGKTSADEDEAFALIERRLKMRKEEE